MGRGHESPGLAKWLWLQYRTTWPRPRVSVARSGVRKAGGARAAALVPAELPAAGCCLPDPPADTGGTGCEWQHFARSHSRTRRGDVCLWWGSACCHLCAGHITCPGQERGPGHASIASPFLSSCCMPGQCLIRRSPCPQWERQNHYWLFRVIRATVEVCSEGPAQPGASCEAPGRRHLELGQRRLPSKRVNKEGMLSGNREPLAMAGAPGA